MTHYRHSAAILALLATAVAAGCTDADQREFQEAARQVGAQVAEQMDRLGERMDALLGDTETGFDDLAAELRQIDVPALRATIEPRLAEARDEFRALREELEEGTDLTPEQRERLAEVNAEIELLTRETSATLDASDEELKDLGTRLSEALASLQETLASLQAEVEADAGG